MPSVCWSLFLIIIIQRHETFAKVIINPPNAIVTEGHLVNFACITPKRVPKVKWIKEGFNSEFHKYGSWRYKLTGSDTVNFGLQIYPVMSKDQGRYRCEADLGTVGQEPIQSPYATLLVHVPPQQPKIFLDGELISRTTLLEGEETELVCISERGRPAHEMYWKDGSGEILNKTVQNYILPHGDTFTVKSVLKINPKLHHHNTTISCWTENDAERSLKVTWISILVEPKQILENVTDFHNDPADTDFNTDFNEETNASQNSNGANDSNNDVENGKDSNKTVKEEKDCNKYFEEIKALKDSALQHFHVIEAVVIGTLILILISMTVMGGKFIKKSSSYLLTDWRRDTKNCAESTQSFEVLYPVPKKTTGPNHSETVHIYYEPIDTESNVIPLQHSGRGAFLHHR